MQCLWHIFQYSVTAVKAALNSHHTDLTHNCQYSAVHCTNLPCISLGRHLIFCCSHLTAASLPFVSLFIHIHFFFTSVIDRPNPSTTFTYHITSLQLFCLIAGVVAPPNIPNNNFVHFSTPAINTPVSSLETFGCHFISSIYLIIYTNSQTEVQTKTNNNADTVIRSCYGNKTLAENVTINI